MKDAARVRIEEEAAGRSTAAIVEQYDLDSQRARGSRDPMSAPTAEAQGSRTYGGADGAEMSDNRDDADMNEGGIVRPEVCEDRRMAMSVCDVKPEVLAYGVNTGQALNNELVTRARADYLKHYEDLEVVFDHWQPVTWGDLIA